MKIEDQEEKVLKMVYKNWKGKISNRTIYPTKIFLGSTLWHEETQWLIEAWDFDKNQHRTFAVKDIIEFK